MYYLEQHLNDIFIPILNVSLVLDDTFFIDLNARMSFIVNLKLANQHSYYSSTIYLF